VLLPRPGLPIVVATPVPRSELGGSSSHGSSDGSSSGMRTAESQPIVPQAEQGSEAANVANISSSRGGGGKNDGGWYPGKILFGGKK